MAMAILQKPFSKEDLDCFDDYDSSICSESWDDTTDSSLQEIEERLTEFSHVGSTPMLAEMIFNTADFKITTKPRHKGDDSSVSSGDQSTASENVLTKSSKMSFQNFALRRKIHDFGTKFHDFGRNLPILIRFCKF